MTNCWYCGSEMIWETNFNYNEVHSEGKGIISILTCTNKNCKAKAEFSKRDDREGED